MGAINIVVKDDAVRAALRRGQDALTNMEPVYRVVGIRVREIVKGHIRTSQSPDGVPYAPLKRPRPRGHRQDARPLWDTGRLLRSIASRPGPRGVVVGTDVVYAAVHNFGSRRRSSLGRRLVRRLLGKRSGGGGIPQREFMGLGEKELTTVVQIIDEAVKRRVAGAMR